MVKSVYVRVGNVDNVAELAHLLECETSSTFEVSWPSPWGSL